MSTVAAKRAGGDSVLVPSVTKDETGAPRFVLPVPRSFLCDVSIRHLVERETKAGGFEYPTRAFFDTHLRPGDVFIDVGAHWGVMALSAASWARGKIDVLAIEPHPTNVSQLMRAVAHNGLDAAIEIISAAAGDGPGTAPLVVNSTMGNSLYGLGLHGLARGRERLSVPVLTLDALMAERPALAVAAAVHQDRRRGVRATGGGGRRRARR